MLKSLIKMNIEQNDDDDNNNTGNNKIFVIIRIINKRAVYNKIK
jgi:hypothetical protein